MNFLKNKLSINAKTIGTGIIVIITFFYILFLPPPSMITKGHLGMIMLGMIIASIILGFPIAFTLMGLGMFFGFIGFGNFSAVFELMVVRTFGVMTLDVIIAVPLFIFMGYIVERSGIIDRLFKSLEVAMKGVPGALAVATVATCAILLLPQVLSVQL